MGRERNLLTQIKELFMSVTKVDFANRSSKYPCNVDIHNLDLTSSFNIKEVDLKVR